MNALVVGYTQVTARAGLPQLAVRDAAADPCAATLGRTA
jgi:hypothetical protein